jgi:hypothetical protein
VSVLRDLIEVFKVAFGNEETVPENEKHLTDRSQALHLFISEIDPLGTKGCSKYADDQSYKAEGLVAPF